MNSSSPHNAAQQAWLAGLVPALFDFEAAPGRYPVVLHEPRAVFEQLQAVLLLAVGRPVQGLEAVLAASPGQEQAARRAARFFVRTVLLRPGADHYSLLGLKPGDDAAQVREHYRLMIRLTHPDFAAGSGEAWPADAASRINIANDVLSSAVQRSVYNAALAAAAVPAVPVARAASASAAAASSAATAGRPLAPPRVALPRAPRAPVSEVWKRRAQIAALSVGAVVAAGLLLFTGGGGEDGSLAVKKVAPVAVSGAVDVALVNGRPAGDGLNKGVGSAEAAVRSVATPLELQALAEVSRGPDAAAKAANRAAVAAAAADGANAEMPLPAGTAARAQAAALVAPTSSSLASSSDSSSPSSKAAPAWYERNPFAGDTAVQAIAAPVVVAVAAAAVPASSSSSSSASSAPAAAPAAVLSSPSSATVRSATSAGGLGLSMDSRMAATADNNRMAEAGAPVINRIAISEVQPQLANVMSALQSGRGETVVQWVDRNWRSHASAASFVSSYNLLLAGQRVTDLGKVSFRSRMAAEFLVVDGVIEMQLQDGQNQQQMKELHLRAYFLPQDGAPVLTQLVASQLK